MFFVVEMLLRFVVVWLRARFICVHRGTSLHSHKTRGVRKTKNSYHQRRELQQQ